MSEVKADVLLLPMELDDIPQVAEIDRLSFPLPWPARAYRYELTENSASHFTVAVQAKDLGPGPRLWPPAPNHRTVVGYIGFWQVVDEAHISTIAVHPDYRGLGVGEQLLAAGLLAAADLGGTQATLEVRVGNTAAQNLYRKFGFGIVGKRIGYYRDNGEDALVMNVYALNNPAFRQRLLGVIGDQ